MILNSSIDSRLGVESSVMFETTSTFEAPSTSQLMPFRRAPANDMLTVLVRPMPTSSASELLTPGTSEASCTNGTDVGFGTGSQGGNVPLNKLYVTLLNAIGATNAGMPITQFGVCDSNDLAAGITKPGELDLIKA